jgi:hypothetical protein
MILIQLVLSLGLITLFWWFLSRPGSYQVRAWIKIFMALFVLLAIVVVILPNSSNYIAHWFGIKRGADLLLYLLTLAFIFVVLNNYIKDKENQRKLIVVTRRLAILETKLSQQDNASEKLK